MSNFNDHHFSGQIILWAVRWYCKYSISYRELTEMLKKRGVNVDHTTVVKKYAPEIEKRLHWYWKLGWLLHGRLMKPTSVMYLCRAITDSGEPVDFYLSTTRNTKAAIRFLSKALCTIESYNHPATLNTDNDKAYIPTIPH